MSGEAADDAGVSGDLGVPAAGLGVVAEGSDLDELVLEGGDELDAGGEVVALFADVGVGAGFGDEVAGAVAVRHAGLEHFGPEPLHPVGDDRLTDRGDGQGEPAAGLAHRLVVGGADGG